MGSGTQVSPLGDVGTLTAETRERLGYCAVWAVAFLLVAYLALQGGGYDTIVHGEIGIAAWWLVAIGALVGVFPRARLSAPAGAALALIGLLAVWTAVGMDGSESAERTAADLARLAAYAGILALAICVQGRGALRPLVYGVASAIALVALLAAGSRLHPAWFPDNVTADFLPGARKRLSYPLNYWNAVGCLMAIGVPLLLGAASTARTLVAQALAAAAVPLVLLTAMLTLSRGSAIAVALAVFTYFALAPDRGRQLATLLVTGAGGGILIAAVLQRDPLLDALDNAAARDDGDQVLVMAVFVCAGVGLLQAAIGLWARHARRREGLLSPAVSAAALVAVALAALALAGAVLGAGDAWREFKEPSLSAEREFNVGRYGEASGSGRYQYWRTAAEAAVDEPVTGIGAGAYGLFWSREGDYWYGIRDAHSLYLEKLAEQGLPGFALIVALMGLVLWVGVVRSLRAPPLERTLAAAATAGFLAFAFVAGVDWVWEVGAVAAAALLLAAALLVPDNPAPHRERGRGAAGWALTGALVLAAIAAVLAILPPIAGTDALRESRAEASAGNFDAATGAADRAGRAQPDAAAPVLQRALIRERLGDLDGAAADATEATRREPTNYRGWLVLSRIEAGRGEARDAVRAFRRARSLSPRAPFLGGGPP